MQSKILRLNPAREHLHGATLAQEHLEKLLPLLSKPSVEPIVFLLDLSNAVSVTASYLRATLHWALLCGQADVQQKTFDGTLSDFSVRPLPLFPVVTGCSNEVIADVDDFFRGRSLPLHHVTKFTECELKSARLLGTLDSVLATTLRQLGEAREATAAQLAEQGGEAITVNGWSNRLADLYLLRLVTRRRSGKFWIYSPLVKSITLWA